MPALKDDSGFACFLQTKMKRYCFFIANYLPNLGGVERYTLNLAKALQEKGIDSITIVTNNVFNLPAEETEKGIRIIRLPCFKLLDGRFPVPRLNKKFRSLYSKLQNDTFDFVIVQTRFYPHSLIGARFAKKKRIPCIVIEHGTSHFTVHNRFFDVAGHIYEHAETILLKRYTDSFFGVSQACNNWLRHFHITAKGILYNSVNVDDIQRIIHSSAYDYREKYGKGHSGIVCYAGRLVPEKGVRKLIEAVELLNRESINVLLLVAGDGMLLNVLKKENHPDVIYLGKLDFDHVISLYHQSDVFCLPTDYPEGFPTTVLEAAASDCYVIATEKGGSGELILSEEYGMILQENNAKNIAEAIKKAILDDKYRASAIKKAYERVKNTFVWEKTSEKVIQIEKKMNNQSQ